METHQRGAKQGEPKRTAKPTHNDGIASYAEFHLSQSFPLPPEEENTKGVEPPLFTSCICLSYGWSLSHLPSHCVCSKTFSISHALSCPHARCLPHYPP